MGDLVHADQIIPIVNAEEYLIKIANKKQEELMSTTTTTTGKLGSIAEDLFIDLFCDVFGPENSQYLSVQHPFVDIYGNRRYIDFAMEAEGEKIAIEVDGETYHNPNKVSSNKYYDDLLKQNSMVYDGR